MESKKVTIIGLKNNNLGDQVILDTCKFLLQKIDSNLKIKIMNLFPDEDIMENYSASFPFIDMCIQKFENYPYLVQVLQFLKWWNFQKRNTQTYNYYKKNLRNAEKVVFVGGGIIKFSRENFWNAIYSIVTYCNRKRTPVSFNAVGVEGFDQNDFNSQLLKYSLNKKCVKQITTRDDLASLNKYVKSNKNKIVGDAALWSKELYGSFEQEHNDIIGIGVIRGGIFVDYGYEFSDAEILNSYVELIRALEKRGYKWQIFCNGIIRDYKMGKRILEELGYPITEEYLVKRPKKAKNLVKTISSYKAIIAARLHANIIAVSYGIPSVGLVWNDKLTIFGELLGIKNRFITKENWQNSDLIISQLEKAMVEGYNIDKINTLKQETVLSLQSFIQS